MKFYSTETKKFYDTEEECVKAEKAAKEKALAVKKAEDKKLVEKKADAEKVVVAYKAWLEAQKVADNFYNKYIEAKAEFINKYGSFHMTNVDGEVKVTTGTEMLNRQRDFFSDLFGVSFFEPFRLR